MGRDMEHITPLAELLPVERKQVPNAGCELEAKPKDAEARRE
jgi:hypothetical protein